MVALQDGRLKGSSMSALGQKQTYAVHNGMSALPPIATVKADMCPPPLPPKADIDPGGKLARRRKQEIGGPRAAPSGGNAQAQQRTCYLFLSEPAPTRLFAVCASITA
jgi:hypothetical protein